MATEREIGYTLPMFNSVMEQNLTWHAAKLSEETGEVCQAIIKDFDAIDIALECVDVIQCAENILRKLNLTPGLMDQVRQAHIDSADRRGYIA